MLQELPKYDYDERGAVVTWRGERVFDLVQGKSLWIVSVNGVETEFDSFRAAEDFMMQIVGDSTLYVRTKAKWYVISNASFRAFGSEDRAKDFIEKILRVREIIHGTAKPKW